MKRLAIVAFGSVCLLLFAGGSATTSASTLAGAKTYWLTGIKAVLPANAASAAVQKVSINSVSCSSPGNCSAVGSYLDENKNSEGLLLTETTGGWRAGVEAAIPANGAGDVELYLVSCASAGNCAAVGGYVDASDGAHGLLLTETAGVWSAGLEPALPANAGSEPEVALRSVSCVSTGNCTAVGSYDNDSSGSDGLVLTETEGVWARGTEAALPSNSGTQDFGSLAGISCNSAGNCAAIGQYGDASGNLQGLLLTEAAGVWGAGIEAPLPANALTSHQAVELRSVSCAAAGNCSAVGDYTVGLDRQGLPAFAGLLLTETAGTWAATANPSVLFSVSCPAAGTCTAVGAGDLVLTETQGSWGSGVEVALPANASKKKGPVLRSVSCVSVGSCSAVGAYYRRSGSSQGLLLTETAGSWARGVGAVVPSKSGHGGGLDSVSCASPGNCAAVGSYLNGSDSPQGLLLSSSTTPPPCVVPRLKGKTLTAAKRSTTSHACSVGVIKHATSRKVKRGHVISQKPSAGRHLKHGAKVDLVVSEGPPGTTTVTKSSVGPDRQDRDGAVYRYYPGYGYRFDPLLSFAQLNLEVSDARSLATRRLAAALLARAVHQGQALVWQYDFPYGGPVPWSSGFVQVTAAEALARAGRLLLDPDLSRAGDAAFRALGRGLLLRRGHGLWIREYGFSQQVILNSQLQSVLSLAIYARISQSPAASRVDAALQRAALRLLPRFDLGCHSLYQLGGPVADAHYQAYHVELLRRLARAYPFERVWGRTAARWSRCV